MNSCRQHSSGWWNFSVGGSSWSVQQWSLGNCLWWFLEPEWRHCSLQTIGISRRYYFVQLLTVSCLPKQSSWNSYIFAAISFTESASFGQGTGNIVFDDVACTGTEASLFDCPNSGLNIHNCGHSEDAGVVCMGTKETQCLCKSKLA